MPAKKKRSASKDVLDLPEGEVSKTMGLVLYAPELDKLREARDWLRERERGKEVNASMLIRWAILQCDFDDFPPMV